MKAKPSLNIAGVEFDTQAALFHDARATLRLLAPKANLVGGSWGI